MCTIFILGFFQQAAVPLCRAGSPEPAAIFRRAVVYRRRGRCLHRPTPAPQRAFRCGLHQNRNCQQRRAQVSPPYAEGITVAPNPKFCVGRGAPTPPRIPDAETKLPAPGRRGRRPLPWCAPPKSKLPAAAGSGEPALRRKDNGCPQSQILRRAGCPHPAANSGRRNETTCTAASDSTWFAPQRNALAHFHALKFSKKRKKAGIHPRPKIYCCNPANAAISSCAAFRGFSPARSCSVRIGFSAFGDKNTRF